MADGIRCPLCDAISAFALQLPRRPLHACPRCQLRFVPAAAHLPPERERARYELHRNSADDAGYVRFLRPVADGLMRHARKGARVLDYGSGPTPVLAGILAQEGFEVTAYDPYFAPSAPLDRPFDAIVSVETFEHFRQPGREMDRLAAMLVPGGLLLAMTELRLPDCDFRTWHYAGDETHIAFYSDETFRFISAAWALRLVETDAKRLVVLAKAG